MFLACKNRTKILYQVNDEDVDVDNMGLKIILIFIIIMNIKTDITI